MSEHALATNEVKLGRYAPAFALFGIAGIVVTGVIGLQPDHAKSTLQSYLFAVILFLSITLGCFSLSILQHVLQGKWGLPMLRIFESGGGVRNLLLMAVLFIPIGIGAKYIYPW